MGYTHYFNFKKGTEEFPTKFVEDVKKVLEGKERYIQLEFDEKKPIMVNEKMICFNGKGKNGHETFLLTPEKVKFGFCKTARKPYDLYVCLVLALAKHHFGDEFELSSETF